MADTVMEIRPLHPNTTEVRIRPRSPKISGQKFGCCVVAIFTATVFVVILMLGPGSSSSKSGITVEPEIKTRFREDHVKKYNEMRMSIKQMENETMPISCNTTECIKSGSALLKSMNTDIDPCDDFYGFVCDNWSHENSTFNDTKWDQFTALDRRSSKMTIDILKEPLNHKDPQVLDAARSFFKDCIDIDQLEKDGLFPMFSILENYGGLPLLKPLWSDFLNFDFIKSVTDLKRIFSTDAIFEIRVDQQQYSWSNKIEILQPSLFIPQSILLDNVKHSLMAKGYRSLMILIALKMNASPDILKIKGAGLDSLQDISRMMSQIDDVIAFEKEIARASLNIVSDRDKLVYGVEIPLSQLDEYLESKKESAYSSRFSRFQPWQLYDNIGIKGVSVSFSKLLTTLFQSAGIRVKPTQVVTITDINYLTSILSTLEKTPKVTISNYLHFRMAYFMISQTTSEMRNILPSSLNASLADSIAEREKSCGTFAESNFGLAIGYKYIQNGFLTLSAKKDIQKLFEDMLSSYRELLHSTKDWMNKRVHSQLMQKVDSLKSCIGFPDWIENTTAVDTPFRRTNFFKFQAQLKYKQGHLANYLKITEWQGSRKFSILNEPINTDCDWGFEALVNAFYDKLLNNIDLPPGVLQFPLFAQYRPKSLNYGALGTIIGHELTHGYSITDTSLVTSTIFQKEVARYINSRNCLVEHYDNIESLNSSDVHLSGQLTLDENFADVGGLSAAYYSLIDHLHKTGMEQRIPGLEEYDSEQLFFISFAHNWCSSDSEDRFQNELATDNHSPPRQRVLGALRNSNEFARAWNCPLGSKMNRNSDKKCVIF